MDKLVEFTITNQAGERIDKIIASYHEEFSRSFIQKLIKNGKVFVNDYFFHSRASGAGYFA